MTVSRRFATWCRSKSGSVETSMKFSPRVKVSMFTFSLFTKVNWMFPKYLSQVLSVPIWMVRLAINLRSSLSGSRELIPFLIPPATILPVSSRTLA